MHFSSVNIFNGITEHIINLTITNEVEYICMYCKDRKILAGNPPDRPADGSDGWLDLWRETHERGMNLSPFNSPPPLQHEWTSARATCPFITSGQNKHKTLYCRPLKREVRGAVPRPEPGESPRERMLTSLPGYSSIRSSKPPWSTRPRDNACATLSLYPFLVS